MVNADFGLKLFLEFPAFKSLLKLLKALNVFEKIRLNQHRLLKRGMSFFSGFNFRKKSFALSRKKDVIGFDFADGICLNLTLQ